MGDARNTLFVSAVSALEIAIKFRIGQLPQMAGRIDLYEGGLIEDGLSRLPISTEHGLRAGLLDAEHRDPFDRVLAAQALVEDLTLLTRDSRIPAFGCKVLW
jgi:PIN domain nuclease of toxin-antitoxin system